VHWEGFTTISNGPADPLDLERDLPTTTRDVDAQGQLRGSCSHFEGYLRFLAGFEPPTHEGLRKKPGPRGDVPFELPGLS
jgi:hypothetical protein